MAQNIHQTDDRQGNAYTFMDITHVTGTATTSNQVDQSAVTITHIPVSGQTALTLTTEYSLGSASGGLKTITVASGAASGTYTFCIRHTGSAAGIGSFKTPHA